MSDYPAVDFEKLATKYSVEANENKFRADQLENIAETLKGRLDAATEQLSDAHRKINELTEAQTLQSADDSVAPGAGTVIQGETV